MTNALVFEQSHPGPGTHVLVVGIGDYPYLLGGTHAKPDIADGMGQLASPPRSARAVADWFIDNFQNDARPLSSVSLVLSEEKKAEYRGKQVPRGTTNDVLNAIDDWVNRSSENEENLAIFFFAGHGVTVASPLLLMRDYGERKSNRFDGAIRFDTLRSGMAMRTPGYQLFLVDACRSPSSLTSTVRENPDLGRAAIDPQVCREAAAKQSVHHATTAYNDAHGRSDGLGIYTEAILKALNGGGAQANLGWWVGTDGLNTALSAYTDRISRDLGVEQVPERIGGVSFRINKPVELKVPVYVSCAPREVWSQRIHFEAKLDAEIAHVHDHDPTIHKNVDEWSLVVNYREHRLSLRFDSTAPFGDIVDELLRVGMPETPIELQVPGKSP